MLQPPETPVTKSKCRNGWAPLIIKVGDKLSVILLWKLYRGDIKIYCWNREKGSRFGNVKECFYSDGNFLFTDELGQSASLLENLLDPSIIGGSNKFANEIADLKSRGESAGIAQIISALVKDDMESFNSIPGGLQNSLLVAKVDTYVHILCRVTECFYLLDCLSRDG